MGSIETGKRGELAAAVYLRRKGYEILCANYRTRLGEIDIIAADAQYLAFVEVKTRAQDSLTLPREAVSKSKQERLIRTAGCYLSGHKTSLQPRFDVIEVIIPSKGGFRVLSVNHIKNAFTL